jgi:hypothetical protein
MWKALAFMYDAIREALGTPASLYRLFDAQRDLGSELNESPQVIDAESVVKWHEWGAAPFARRFHRAPGELPGWRYCGGTYSSFHATREEFVNFGACEITEGWQCDIQDVTGLAASKSNLMSFASLDAMVESNSKELIDAITEEKLRENLAHDEIRILHRDPSYDFFARYLWDGRTFLMNSGGSHHFTAARYIAARLKIPVPLRGRLCTYSINQTAIDKLTRDFELFVITDISKARPGFHDAMRSFRATYLWWFLPGPYRDRLAILLPKSEPRSAKVAALLREAKFFDLGLYLHALVAQQDRMKAPEQPLRPSRLASRQSRALEATIIALQHLTLQC